MAKKKKDTMEFRFYEVPQGEAALVLYGDSWVRVYGHDEFHLHFHNLMEIGICRYGKGDMFLNEDLHRYKEGNITIIPDNYPHVTVSDGDSNNFWEYIFFDINIIVDELFEINPVYREDVLKALNKDAIYTSCSRDPVLAELINKIISEAKREDSFSRDMIKLHLKELVYELIRRDSSMPVIEPVEVKGSLMAQVAAALDYINKNFDKTIRVADLAKRCGMSETHYRRIFESYMNMSPLEYVNLIRVQKACEYMKKTNDSMDMVAQKCGFTNPSTFNRNFKKFLNVSPYQWKINPENYESKLLNFRISALKGW